MAPANGSQENANANNQNTTLVQERTETEAAVNAIIDIDSIITATTNAILQAQAQAAAKSLNYNDIATQIPLCGDKDDDDIVLWIKRVDEVRKRTIGTITCPMLFRKLGVN